MVRIENIDCLELLKTIPDNSIDLMLQDPPYGVTQNKWDNAPDLTALWPEWLRVCKDNAAFIFTAQNPFAADLINSKRKLFRYDIVWEKGDRASGFLNANKMPLRSHEHILVFYLSQPTFNPQFQFGKPAHKKGKPMKETNNNYGSYKTLPTRDYGTKKFPKSVVNFDRPHPPIHPTQKPIDLMRYLIRTYSNPGDTVFDGYSGSGTVADACLMEGRNCIAAELNKEYYDYSIKRLQQRRMMPELFAPAIQTLNSCTKANHEGFD